MSLVWFDKSPSVISYELRKAFFTVDGYVRIRDNAIII